MGEEVACVTLLSKSCVCKANGTMRMLSNGKLIKNAELRMQN
jgi:hypothetical protein